MYGSSVRYKELSPTTPLSELDERYYSVPDLAHLLNCHPNTVKNHMRAGKIHYTRRFGSGHPRISRAEVVRILGGEPEDKRYFKYDGMRIPHFSYMLFVMVEAGNDPDRIAERLDQFRLPQLKPYDADLLWQATLATMPDVVRKAAVEKRQVARARGFRDWVEGMGIAPMFDNIVYPCRDILLDHSPSRVYLEALLGGRVPLAQIMDFIERRWGKLYNVEQLKFYRHYFYNVSDFTAQEYLKYINMLADEEEIQLKRQAWDNPDTAKLNAGIPARADTMQDLQRFTAASRAALDAYIASGNTDPRHLKVLLDTYTKAHEAMLKEKAAQKADVDEAMHAAAANTSIEIENVVDEPVLYEDLEQPDEETSGEGVSQAG